VSAKLADRNHPGTLIQTVKAFLEAKAYPGPSMIIAYAPCIAHGYDLCHGLEQQKAAVQSAYWPLFRYHPEWAAAGRNPFVLDSRTPSLPLDRFLYKEDRYSMLVQSAPETAALLLTEAQMDVDLRWKLYQNWAQRGPVLQTPELAEKQPG
jgi:pyruvate-ferredoxin/flavodoxin oxidoreductase